MKYTINLAHLEFNNNHSSTYSTYTFKVGREASDIQNLIGDEYAVITIIIRKYDVLHETIRCVIFAY